MASASTQHQQQNQQRFPATDDYNSNDAQPEKVLCVLEAIHDFEARGDDELTLLRGELVEVLENDGEIIPCVFYPTPAVGES